MNEHYTNLEIFHSLVPKLDAVSPVDFVALEKDYKVPGATVVNSIEEAMEAVKEYDTNDVYIIGGGSIYRQFLPYCDIAHVTKIDYEYEADTYFPNLDEDDEWELTGDSDEQTYYDLEYRFLRYERKK